MRNKKNRKNVWLKLWKLLAPFYKRLYVILFLITLNSLFAFVAPYIFKIIIDKLNKFNFNSSDLFYLILLFFFSNQITFVLIYFKDKLAMKLLTDIYYYLPNLIYKKLLFLSLNYHEKENTGNKIVKINNGMDKILGFFSSLFWDVIPSLLQFLITFLLLFLINWTLSLIFIGFSLLFFVVVYISNKKQRFLREKRYKNYEIAGGVMTQAIININIVKSFVQERAEFNRFKKIKRKVNLNDKKEINSFSKFLFLRNSIMNFGRVSVLASGTYLICQGMISVGSLVFAVMLSEKAFGFLYRFSHFYDVIEDGFEAVNRLLKVLDEKNDIINYAGAKKVKTIQGNIEFKNLSFAYNKTRKRALSNINLKIDQGSTVAFVGPSGGGKTTLAKMIYRHYDPQKGKILLDGVDLKNYDIWSFRKNIAIVPQEVGIFDLSIKNNIAYGCPNATMKEIVKAAKIANADEFIKNLPKKYNTLVGERGFKLSGGQKQRLGIARAILANPKILIFDEATSNLDSYSERLIQDALSKILKDRTTILIAHRLSTIKQADKIIVLKKGKIIEQGNHKELLNQKKGLYSELLNLQRVGDIS